MALSALRSRGKGTKGLGPGVWGLRSSGSLGALEVGLRVRVAGLGSRAEQGVWASRGPACGSWG